MFTDPYTGQYNLDLPQGTYTLHIDPVSPGYQTVTDTVSVDSADTTHDVTARVTPTCDAPGYASSPMTQPFSGWSGATAEDGWTVVDEAGTGETWNFGNPTDLTNPGGDADFASIDSLSYPVGHHQDTSLISPVADLSAVDSPLIRFDTNAVGRINGIKHTQVDLSVDGGNTWQNVWGNTFGPINTGPVSIPVPQAAGKSAVKLRFHYVGGGDASDRYGWWAVDNVGLGSCAPTPGGLVAGVVSDTNTGDPVNRAMVASEVKPDESATTAATSDPAVPNGFYTLFSSSTGPSTLTASRTGYQTAAGSVEVAADALVRKDWSLGAGRLAASPSEVQASTVLDDSTTAKVTFTNNGSSPLHLDLGTQNAGSRDCCTGR